MMFFAEKDETHYDTFSHRSTMFPNALQRLDRSLTLSKEPEIDGCFTVVLKLARRIYFYFIGKPPGWLLWLTVLKYCAGPFLGREWQPMAGIRSWEAVRGSFLRSFMMFECKVESC